MTVEYKTVFEISHKGFTWWFALAGLLPAVAGTIIWRWRRAHPVSKRAIWLMLSYPTFTVLWLSSVSIPMAITYLKLQRAYQLGQYSTVEGQIEDFRPMPPQGHASECFRVQMQQFCYGSDSIMPGFNNDSAHGGPIRTGLPVRIGYRGDDILRLEVATNYEEK